MRWVDEDQDKPRGMDLFKRVPTDEEKVYYRRQWGGVHPLRAWFGMMGAYAIGVMCGWLLP